jgi:hypothetical protein
MVFTVTVVIITLVNLVILPLMTKKVKTKMKRALIISAWLNQKSSLDENNFKAQVNKIKLLFQGFIVYVIFLHDSPFSTVS